MIPDLHTKKILTCYVLYDLIQHGACMYAILMVFNFGFWWNFSDEFCGICCVVFIGMDKKLVLCFLHENEIEDDAKNLISDISHNTNGENI
jgi:molybdenum cofactor biosynthesis enzyme MoaA